MLSHHEGLGQGVEERRDGGAVKWSKRRTQGQSIIILCSASSPSELIHAHTLRGSASDDTNNWAISCTMAVHKSCTMAMHTLQISFPSKNVTLKTFCVQGECVCNRYKGCGKISCQCSVRDQFVDKYHNIFADGFLQRKYSLILHVEIPSPKNYLYRNTNCTLLPFWLQLKTDREFYGSRFCTIVIPTTKRWKLLP